MVALALVDLMPKLPTKDMVHLMLVKVDAEEHLPTVYTSYLMTVSYVFVGQFHFNWLLKLTGCDHFVPLDTHLVHENRIKD